MWTAPAGATHIQLQGEPPLQTRTGWNTQPGGMVIVGYDLNGNGTADFYTVRTLVRSYMSAEPLVTVAGIYPASPIFYVSYQGHRYLYIATPQPLFYVYDVDEDGHWDLIYKDVLEDGVNGNEQFYDSPSGMF